MMTKEEFIHRVQMFTPPADFAEHRSSLDNVNPVHYQTFLILIAKGSKIDFYQKALDNIDVIALQSVINAQILQNFTERFHMINTESLMSPKK